MTSSARRANTSGENGPPPAEDGTPARNSDFVQSLDRGLAVIRAFGPDRERLSLSEVAKATGLTRAAARRFLLTLVKLGYVRNDGREFSLRPRVLELGYAYLSGLALPEVAAPHLEELVAQGKTGHIVVQREMQLWFIDEDPDEAWATLGPYFLKESQQYSSWRRTGVERSFSNTSQSVAELRATRVYEILTPDQALARMRAATDDYMPIVQPLTGGLPLDRAWRCLELFGAVMKAI